MKTCSIKDCTNKHYAMGWCEKHHGRWRRYGDPEKLLTAPRGSAINAQGYRNYGGRLEHVEVAEKAIGRKLNSGEVVHHVDENKTNNNSSNLVICSIGYHKVIHQRTNALNASGNANWRKCRICKEYDDPKNMYVYGTGSVHNECRKKQHKEKRGDLFFVGSEITANGKTMRLQEWSRISGISRTTIATRIKTLGWSESDAVSVPPRAIKKAIADGFVVPGAHIEQHVTVSIK